MIVEDSVGVQECLSCLLDPEYEVVAVVANGLEAVRLAQELKPELMTLDISLPDLNGI